MNKYAQKQQQPQKNKQIERKVKMKNPNEHKIITQHTHVFVSPFVYFIFINSGGFFRVHQAWNVHCIVFIRIWEAAVVRRHNVDAWEKRHVCLCGMYACNVGMFHSTYGLARSGHDLLWFHSRDQLNENYRHHRLKCTRRYISEYTEVIARIGVYSV